MDNVSADRSAQEFRGTLAEDATELDAAIQHLTQIAEEKAPTPYLSKLMNKVTALLEGNGAHSEHADSLREIASGLPTFSSVEMRLDKSEKLDLLAAYETISRELNGRFELAIPALTWQKQSIKKELGLRQLTNEQYAIEQPVQENRTFRDALIAEGIPSEKAGEPASKRKKTR